MKASVFTFHAYGHSQVSSTHPTTLEITTDDYLTAEGDCIVAVRASCGLKGLPREIKEALSSDSGRAVMTIRVRSETFQVEGKGSKGLTFLHPQEIVARKSRFISDRTLMVEANRAARDIPPNLVRLLQNPEETVTIEIRASLGPEGSRGEASLEDHRRRV